MKFSILIKKTSKTAKHFVGINIMHFTSFSFYQENRLLMVPATLIVRKVGLFVIIYLVMSYLYIDFIYSLFCFNIFMFSKASKKDFLNAKKCTMASMRQKYQPPTLFSKLLCVYMYNIFMQYFLFFIETGEFASFFKNQHVFT